MARRNGGFLEMLKHRWCQFSLQGLLAFSWVAALGSSKLWAFSSSFSFSHEIRQDNKQCFPSMDNLLTSGVFYICCRNALEIQIVAGVGQPLITPAVILPDSKLIPLLEQNCSRCGRRLSNSYEIDSCQWAGYVEAWWCVHPPWKWWNGQQSNSKRMFILQFCVISLSTFHIRGQWLDRSRWRCKMMFLTSQDPESFSYPQQLLQSWRYTRLLGLEFM